MTDQVRVLPVLEKIFIRDLLARVVTNSPGGSSGGATVVYEAGGVVDLTAVVEAGAETVFAVVTTPGALTLNFPTADATRGRSFVLILLCDQDPTSYLGTVGGVPVDFAIGNTLVNLGTVPGSPAYAGLCFPTPDFGVGFGWRMWGIAFPTLGDAAAKNVGTGSGDVAAGNAVANHVAATDPHGDRGWAQSQIFDLRGVFDTATARINLGLGGAATKNVGTGSTQVSPGDWPASAVATHAGATDPHGDRAHAASLIAALGGAASLNVGTTAGTVAAGDDPRFAGVPTTALGAYVDSSHYLLTRSNGAQSTTNVATAANTILFWLIEVLEPVTIDGLFVYVNTGAASAKWRPGLYAINPSTGKPTGSPIVQDNEIDASVGSTYKTDTFTASPILAPGVYGAAMASNSSTTAYRISTGVPNDHGSAAATNIAYGSMTTPWTYSSAGLPDVTGFTISPQNAAAPYVRWRVRR